MNDSNKNNLLSFKDELHARKPDVQYIVQQWLWHLILIFKS